MLAEDSKQMENRSDGRRKINGGGCENQPRQTRCSQENEEDSDLGQEHKAHNKM
jgi:hypothetical protein